MWDLTVCISTPTFSLLSKGVHCSQHNHKVCISLYVSWYYDHDLEATRKSFLLISRILRFQFPGRLCSKRFRGVWEQRNTEEGDLRCFSHTKNGAAPFFAWAKRQKSRSSDFLCSPTPRKRLLRSLVSWWGAQINCKKSSRIAVGCQWLHDSLE